VKEHVLVVEDDPHIRVGLVELLKSESYRVTECGNGAEVLHVVARVKPDLVLLDIMLPGTSGYDLCRELRQAAPRLPVIFLSAKGQEIDKVVGLKLGADDYVTKPFAVQELLARIEVVLRRSRPAASADALPEEIAFGPVRIETRALRGVNGRRRFDLTPRELRVLWVLIREAENAVDRNQLLTEVWGQEYFGTTRTLDQVIAKLRRKVEPDPKEPRYVLTVHGVGYRFQKEDR
jgi:DNA-binding response OmpR family regulator